MACLATAAAARSRGRAAAVRNDFAAAIARSLLLEQLAEDAALLGRFAARIASAIAATVRSTRSRGTFASRGRAAAIAATISLAATATLLLEKLHEQTLLRRSAAGVGFAAIASRGGFARASRSFAASVASAAIALGALEEEAFQKTTLVARSARIARGFLAFASVAARFTFASRSLFAAAIAALRLLLAQLREKTCLFRSAGIAAIITDRGTFADSTAVTRSASAITGLGLGEEQPTSHEGESSES